MEHLPMNRTPLQDQDLWNMLSATINPFVRVMTIHGVIFRTLSPSSKSFIAEQFFKHVEEPLMYCRDGSGPDRYFLGNPRHFLSTGGTVIAVGDRDPIWFMPLGGMLSQTATVCLPPLPNNVKIPRPPNAYILYRKDRHSMVKKADPKLTNNEVSQILGRSWNAEPQEVRQRYKKMSEDIKTALLERHPQYQYQPRKSVDKKRRARRRAQAGAAAQGSGSSSSANSTPESTPSGSEYSMSPESSA